MSLSSSSFLEQEWPNGLELRAGHCWLCGRLLGGGRGLTAALTAKNEEYVFG